MKGFLFLLTLFLMIPVGNTKLTELKFYRYAQPQLKNLTTEFFVVLKRLNVNNAYYTDIQRSITIHINKLQACESLKFCVAIDRLNTDLNNYEQKLWTLQKQLTQNKILEDKIPYDTVIASFAHAQKMQLEIFNLKAQLDHFFALNKNNDSKEFKFQILKDLKYIFVLSQQGSTSLLSDAYKDDFNFINENFIREIQQHILMNNDINFLKRRYRELDNSWNSFHLKVDREVQNFPKSSLNLIKVMHNRWNSILKLILR